MIPRRATSAIRRMSTGFPVETVTWLRDLQLHVIEVVMFQLFDDQLCQFLS
jgi:hypothetical protein